MELNGNFVTTLAELRELLTTTDKLTFVYFYTEWSPPCRNLRFDFMQVALTNTDTMMYVAVNMDHSKAIGGKLDITLDDIPALVVFKNGHKISIIKHLTKADLYNTDYPTEMLEKNPKPL